MVLIMCGFDVGVGRMMKIMMIMFMTTTTVEYDDDDEEKDQEQNDENGDEVDTGVGADDTRVSRFKEFIT